MAEPKTVPTGGDVGAFLEGVEDEQKRADAQALVRMMGEVTGEPPRMWGPSMIGFGQVRYRYASGRQGDWFVLGFAPRKQNLTLYLPGYVEQHQEQLAQLGKHSTGKGCVYVKRLSDVDQAALRRLLEAAVEHHRAATE